MWRNDLKMTTVATIFGYKSHSAISMRFHKVLNVVTEYFVPQYLGPTAFDIKQIEQQNIPKLFRNLFPKSMGVIDGGYIKIDKLSHHQIQKKSYCVHKKSNLVKFIDLCLPDGTIFDTYGPFFSDGNHNDEKLWNHIVEKNLNGICDFFNTSLFFCFFYFTFCFNCAQKTCFILKTFTQQKCS